MAREGRGLTWAPRSLIENDLASGRLMRAGAENWDIAIGVCLFRSRARMTNAAEAFWSTVQKGQRESKTPAKASRH
jgi:DNA-binding transcriptional LysR family regulator